MKRVCLSVTLPACGWNTSRLASPAGGWLPVLGVCRHAQAAHPARVVGVEHAHGHASHDVLALVAGATVVVLAVHERDLHVDLIRPPLAVDPHSEIGGGDVAVALQRHLTLHAVVPQRLFPIDPARMNLPKLERERAAVRG